MTFPHHRVAQTDQLAVARLLAGAGPLTGDTAAARLGWSADRWWRVVERRSEWFALTGRGWVATAAGRKAADVTAADGPAV